jgi:hypothetical protein
MGVDFEMTRAQQILAAVVMERDEIRPFCFPET